MICVVVLQDGMDVVEGETRSNSETDSVTCDVEGTVEVCIKVEEAIDISDEIPEAVTSPAIKTEQEVRLWGVCGVAAHAFREFMPPPKGNCKITFKLFLLCVVFWLPYSFLKFGLQFEEKRLYGSHSH